MAGGLAAAYNARNERLGHFLVEVVGGTLLGVAGGRMPAILEPPTSPTHREFLHSMAFGAGMTASATLGRSAGDLNP